MNQRFDKAEIILAAENYSRAGKLEDAIAEYEKLLDGTPQDVPISNIIGDLYLQLQKQDRALRIFEANAITLEKQGAYAQALAINKKISKLNPSDARAVTRMGDLYGFLGFVSESRAEYLRAAKELESRNDTDALASVYEKLAKLDRGDLDSRLKFAGFLSGQGQTDKAVAELNDIAGFVIIRDDLKEAERILSEALKLRENDVRTVTNLARLYVRQSRGGEAVDLAERTLRKDPENAEMLLFLGDLFFETHADEKAQEIFRRILNEDPENVDARAKLGVLEVRSGRPDDAYQLFEPLVTSLISRGKSDEAIGLLGLIVMSGTMHVPSLEKLAFIYRLNGQKKNLEIADRLLLRVYRGSSGAKRAFLANELTELRPDDAELRRELRSLDPEARIPGEEIPNPRASVPLSEKDRELIRSNLKKAELYLEQGLVRNAIRIMTHLQHSYPGEQRIEQQLAVLKRIELSVDDEEIPIPVEERAEREAQIEVKKPADNLPFPEPLFAPDERTQEKTAAVADRTPERAAAAPERTVEKITAAEIFADTDILPAAARAEVPPPEPERAYLDLENKIQEEIEAIEIAFYKQLKEKDGVTEKDLKEIVADFRRQVEERVDRQNYEVRYNLGLVFLEQGLEEEAIEEFKLAAKEESLAVDCSALISRCYRQKRNLREALRWLDRALELSTQGSHSRYALTYELAILCEDMNENGRALELFRQVGEWNKSYRDVTKRIKILEKISS